MNNNILQSPMTYPDWLNTIGYSADTSQQAYLAYLTSWYNANNKIYNYDDTSKNTREEYIQLIKDLIFLFDKDERDLFLSDIDYNNDEDLMYIIPYVVNKLKQITQVIAKNREDLKNTKEKNKLIGSQDGIEKILYQHILKNFTNKPYQWTKIPVSTLANQLPQLSSIGQNFYIEIEELYDTNNYHDSDPSIPIESYINFKDLLSTEPFSNLSDEELSAIITSRLMLKVAPTPLSKIFNQYLTTLSNLSSTITSDLSSNYTSSIYNQIAANKKYLGESVYGLTAIRNNQVNEADFVLSLNFESGNNWFYWPSGSNLPTTSVLGNIYKPIPINQSNLILNRTVSGSNYKNSDLFFAEKDGVIEGAWLQGHRSEIINDKMNVILNSNDISEFIFPWVGFNINSNDLSFESYSLNDSSKNVYQKLNNQLKEKILISYYNNTLPNSSVYDIYLNQTNLVDSGSHSAFLSDEADSLTVTPSSREFYVWNESTQGKVNEAFLYKFIKTDIYVGGDITDIHWPIQSFEGTTDNLTLTLSSDTCVPIVLGSLDPSKSMIGSVAGRDINTSDVIYKLLDNSNTPVEAAWLGSGSINQLNQIKNAIPIYDSEAVNCAEYLDGPIQPALYQKMNPGEFTSFIWMDKDTPANDVFYYHKHSSTCEYGNSFPHNFYKDQDYQNPSPLNDGKKFPLNYKPCTCKAVNYSPIGAEGNNSTDYHSMSDLLFADPQGLGVDFSYSSWRDTRNFSSSNSPQFSFYKIDGKLDKDVGFGNGSWVTGNGKKMILKTGRRYTYYRSNLRINPNSPTESPYLFVKYPYENISLTCGSDYNNLIDLVILIDNSRTQYFDIEIVKSMAKKICELSLNNNPKSQISIISFSEHGLILNYLTSDLSNLLTSIESIQIPKKYPDWLTNITEGLILANNVLYTTQPFDNDCNYGDTKNLCKNLNSQVINKSRIGSVSNCPLPNSTKKILIFSDGQETVNVGTAETYAQIIKQNGAIITSIDIGYYSLKNKLMENVASDDLYFNLQEYLLYSDINIQRFIENISSLLMGCFPSMPVWCKAKRDSSGNWIGLNVPSDIVLKAGDYLAYVHKNTISYISQNNSMSFNIPSLSFTINVKLDGWDYYTNTFNLSSRGKTYGAKPFWGKTLNSSMSALPYGGSGRVMDEYVILHQPEVSDIVLKNGNYIRYKNSGKGFINWNQDLTFNVTYTNQQWNKLRIRKEGSNLASSLNTRNVEDYIIDQTNEPSDLYLESYSTLNPTRYNFYLGSQNEPFVYNENLLFIDRCDSSFVEFTSGKIIEASYPHLNLDNVHFPTIANIGFPSSFVTERQTGTYLLPDRLGVSYYRGVNYDIKLDPKKISYLDSLNLEYMFLDTQKYGSRNRGLTKNDQITPVEIKNINNKWMIEPYGSGNYSGTIIDSVKNQKFIPYQSNYEINEKDQMGICLQKDSFYFWSPLFYNEMNYSKNNPITFRNELDLEKFLYKVDTLLSDVGIQSEWRTDIYGNDFALFKGYGLETSKYILSEDGYTFTTEYGLRLETE